MGWLPAGVCGLSTKTGGVNSGDPSYYWLESVVGKELGDSLGVRGTANTVFPPLQYGNSGGPLVNLVSVPSSAVSGFLRLCLHRSTGWR